MVNSTACFKQKSEMNDKNNPEIQLKSHLYLCHNSAKLDNVNMLIMFPFWYLLMRVSGHAVQGIAYYFYLLTGLGPGSIPGGGGIFGSVPNDNREEFGQLLILAVFPVQKTDNG